MGIINKKGKLFGVINIIDFAVILVIVVLLGGAFVKFKVLDKTSTNVELVPITYTVEINGVRDYFLENVKEGDKLFDQTSSNCIGTIIKLESKEATEEMEFPNGEISYVPSEGKIDIVLTVNGEGVVNDSGYFINKTYELLRNSKRNFFTKYAMCEGKILDIYEQ